MKRKRHIVIALASLVVGVIGIACAKAPEARTNATSSVEPTTDAGAEVTAAADARVPGLPMPQTFPHFVWDAAGAPARDAAAR